MVVLHTIHVLSLSLFLQMILSINSSKVDVLLQFKDRRKEGKHLIKDALNTFYAWPPFSD